MHAAPPWPCLQALLRRRRQRRAQFCATMRAQQTRSARRRQLVWSAAAATAAAAAPRHRRCCCGARAGSFERHAPTRRTKCAPFLPAAHGSPRVRRQQFLLHSSSTAFAAAAEAPNHSGRCAPLGPLHRLTAASACTISLTKFWCRRVESVQMRVCVRRILASLQIVALVT